MNDWIDKLHGFLSLNDRSILKDAGQISHELALELAEIEYEKFRIQTIAEKDSQTDDFENSINRIEKQIEKNKGK